MPLPGGESLDHIVPQVSFAGVGAFTVLPPTAGLSSPLHNAVLAPPTVSLENQDSPFNSTYARTRSQHVCETCGKQFKQKSHLTRHERVHTGERPFKCDQCDKSFNQSSVLKTHMRIHSKEKPYVCETCNKAFRHSGGLTEHQAVHRDASAPQLQCPYCDRTFKTRPQFSRHKKAHAVAKSQALRSSSGSPNGSESSLNFGSPVTGGGAAAHVGGSGPKAVSSSSAASSPSLGMAVGQDNPCHGTLTAHPLTGTFVFQSTGSPPFALHLAPVATSVGVPDAGQMLGSVGSHVPNPMPLPTGISHSPQMPSSLSASGLGT